MEDNLNMIEEIHNDNANFETEKSFNERFRFKTAFKLCILFCALTTIFFFWRKFDSLSINNPIDSGLFGTFGDFIGGILGTFVALYSVYMLVQTFQNQKETNKDVITTNHSIIKANESVISTNKELINQTRIQIFDSRFTILLNLYHNAINTYKVGEVSGRNAFERIVTEFQRNGLSNNTEYKRRSIGALSEYLNLYSVNRQYFSVHYRMLYLLAKHTAEGKIPDYYRVSYAKNIRGQLSEGEMLILRYNCLSEFGEKMRFYVNKFNLIKHLPLMNLLEFTNWRKKINNDSCCSVINQLYLQLRKTMTSMIYKEEASNVIIESAPRIHFDIHLNEELDSFTIELQMSKHKKKGGAIKRPVIETAFDSFESTEIPRFLNEMFVEMFIYSNFYLFNGDDNHIVSSKIIEHTYETLKVQTTISRPGIQLVLAEKQIKPAVINSVANS